jgi:nitrate/nitrite transport system ATP-binding protein
MKLTTPPPPLLELAGVSRGFGTGPARIDILRDINLRVAEGEFVAVVGYSGSGKTTLLNLLAGLFAPETGFVRLRGLPAPGPGPDRAIVFQNYSLLPWLTVYGNIALAVDAVFPHWPAARRREHVERHIAVVNLTPARDQRPRELSGGMRQRVAVARALATDPAVLLLDEPLGALDALTRATLQDEISRLWQQDRKTVVLVTNDPDEGLYLADRIIPLGAGPTATLGPSFTVDLPRPRDRRALNHDPHFKRLRKDLLEWLLASGRTRAAQTLAPPPLPNVLPEDLTHLGPFDRLFCTRLPKRRPQPATALP